MATSTANPYRPGVGLQPTFLAGRDPDIQDFMKIIGGSPSIPANVRITGLRGVGKTVLLQKLQETSNESGWATISIELEPRHNSDEALYNLVSGKGDSLRSNLSRIKRLKDRLSAAGKVARQAATVTYEGFTWSLAGDLDSRSRELAEDLLLTTELAASKGRSGLILFFDEAQVLVDSKDARGDHALSSLIAAVSTLQKQRVPICLVLCGLPTLAVNLLKARTYSERMFRGMNVGELAPADAAKALTKPLEGTALTADKEFVKRVVRDVDGYPYFIQLWGAEMWDSAVEVQTSEFSNDLLDGIEDRIQDRLDIDFYAPRVEALTPAEQDVLMATAECPYPPLRVSDLNQVSEKSTGNVNVLLGRLVSNNVLYRPRKGEYRYTAPKFRDYLIRRRDSEILS
ncbi:ATP-binding protein [Brachybacterium paraconglomeratum]